MANTITYIHILLVLMITLNYFVYNETMLLHNNILNDSILLYNLQFVIVYFLFGRKNTYLILILTHVKLVHVLNSYIIFNYIQGCAFIIAMIHYYYKKINQKQM
jgi:hypothetical protein